MIITSRDKLSSKGNSSLSQQTRSVINTSDPTLPGSKWVYNQSDDAMGKDSIFQAVVYSSNTVNFKFPYSGEQHGMLSLRNHPRHCKDIIFTIEEGQILCPSYKDYAVLVRFDDEKATNYSAVGAAR